MKRCTLWEIGVAALLPLFVIVLWLMNVYAPGALPSVSPLVSVAILCIAVWTYWRMYLGAKATNRSAQAVLITLVLMAMFRLCSIATSMIPPASEHSTMLFTMAIGLLYLAYFIVAVIVDVRLYKAHFTVLAVALTFTLALPVVSTIVGMVCGMVNQAPAPDTLIRATALLSSLANAAMFLHRNDLFITDKA